MSVEEVHVTPQKRVKTLITLCLAITKTRSDWRAGSGRGE